MRVEKKAKAGHGGWEKLFDADALKRPIRLTVRTARKYMAVAECAAITKSDDLSVFPSAVATLGEGAA